MDTNDGKIKNETCTSDTGPLVGDVEVNNSLNCDNQVPHQFAEINGGDKTALNINRDSIAETIRADHPDDDESPVCRGTRSGRMSRSLSHNSCDTRSEPYSPRLGKQVAQLKGEQASKSLPCSPGELVKDYVALTGSSKKGTNELDDAENGQEKIDASVKILQEEVDTHSGSTLKSQADQNINLACKRTKSRKKRAMLHNLHGVRSEPNSPSSTSTIQKQETNEENNRSLPTSPVEGVQYLFQKAVNTVKGIFKERKGPNDDTRKQETNVTTEPDTRVQIPNPINVTQKRLQLDSNESIPHSMSHTESNVVSLTETNDEIPSFKRKVSGNKRKSHRPRSAVQSAPSSPLMTRKIAGTEESMANNSLPSSPGDFMRQMFLNLGNSFNKMFQSSPK